jgi:hypothetical protein
LKLWYGINDPDFTRAQEIEEDFVRSSLRYRASPSEMQCARQILHMRKDIVEPSSGRCRKTLPIRVVGLLLTGVGNQLQPPAGCSTYLARVILWETLTGEA